MRRLRGYVSLVGRLAEKDEIDNRDDYGKRNKHSHNSKTPAISQSQHATDLSTLGTDRERIIITQWPGTPNEAFLFIRKSAFQTPS
jgi:hypothetical protein